MTAAEIYAIVKDVPREAWPEGLKYSEVCYHFCAGYSFCFIHKEHAELMFVGSTATRVLSMAGQIYPPVPYRETWVVVFEAAGNRPPMKYEASTLIEVLAAACKGVQ